MSALAVLTFLLAETTDEKRQAAATGIGVFLGLSALLFIVTRFNRDR
jgi:hypothetical protein